MERPYGHRFLAAAESIIFVWMPEDASGATRSRDVPEGGRSPRGTRRVTSEERRYVRQCIRKGRWFAQFALGIPIAFVGIFIYLGITENEPAALIIGPIVCLMIAGGLAWVYRDRLQVTDDLPEHVSTITGIHRTSGSSSGIQHWVGATNVALPAHWTGYLPTGDRVTLEVVDAGSIRYAVRSKSGLSITDETSKGVHHLIDAHIGPHRALLFVPAVSALFLVISQILLVISDGGSVGIHPSIDDAIVRLSVVGLMGFGIPAAWMFVRHLRARRRIHQMYDDQGVRHAMSIAERRQLRRSDALRVAPLLALGGWGLAAIYGLNVGATMLIFAGLGALFGSLLREPSKTQ